MKGGECKETFKEWENCVEEGEKNEEDVVGKCYQATANLKKRMEENSDYYARCCRMRRSSGPRRRSNWRKREKARTRKKNLEIRENRRIWGFLMRSNLCNIPSTCL
ncbi:hypothetical protein PHJA_001524400 [Phtheirospermum japonicum]|uniref:GCK domain-containing protein n=1 Tax=Phtheirospermum japonicum TaxID=374723 RepID=A0A830CHF4_9LAMI|nr:hypothetical protein PHJA_001524400 [Phtheirospermum japonicum]